MPIFDAYHKWLGISSKDQPPNHYRLLAIELFEADPDVIDVAASKQVAYLQGCATGPHVALSQELLNEVAAARLCLLNPQKKAEYDRQLRANLTLPTVGPSPVAPSVQPPVSVKQNNIPDMRSTPTYKTHEKHTVLWIPWAFVGVVGLAAVIIVMMIATRSGDKQEVAKASAASNPASTVHPETSVGQPGSNHERRFHASVVAPGRYHETIPAQLATRQRSGGLVL